MLNRCQNKTVQKLVEWVTFIIIKFTRKKIIWKNKTTVLAREKQTKILIYEHPHSLDGAWMLITWIMHKKVHTNNTIIKSMVVENIVQNPINSPFFKVPTIWYFKVELYHLIWSKHYKQIKKPFTTWKYLKNHLFWKLIHLTNAFHC